MFPSRKLLFFISSTGDLQTERASVQESLRVFEIDGLRFEEWPSMPDDPMDVCFEGVQTSDAMVLLLGRSYGTPDKNGLSGTHQEFRYAQKLSRPIFAFLLKSDGRDRRQHEFIAEVQRAHFRCCEIESLDDLAKSLRTSVAAEFSRRWKHFDSHPPESSSPWGEPPPTAPIPILSDRETMLAELKRRYDAGEDEAIGAAAEGVIARYPNDSELLNVIYQAAVNEGIESRPVNLARVEAAIAFWKNNIPVGAMTNAPRFYCLANPLLVLKRYGEAISVYQESLQIYPQFAECWKNLGSAYQDRGDHAEARRAYEEVLKIKPQKFEALYSLATLVIRHLGDPAAALAHLEAIDTAALDSHRVASVIAWRAEAKLLLGRLADAAADAEEAIHLDNEADWTWAAAARVYAQARHSDRSLDVLALRFWERFVVRFPKAAEGWLELGFLLYRLREVRDRQESSRRALIAYEKAIDLGVDDALVWDRTGHLLQEAGRWEEAANGYAKAATVDAASHGYCLAFALRHLARYEEALPHALAAAQKHQPDGMSWLLVADCRSKLRDYEGAVEAYRMAIEVDPEYEKAWFDFGGLRWNLRDPDGAFAIWKVALAKFPESEEAVRLLAFLDLVQLPHTPEAD